MLALMMCTLVAGGVLVWWSRSDLGLREFLALGLVYLYARLWHGWRGNGPAPLPSCGPAILVANHTCSADPAFLTAGCRRSPSFLIAREYCRNPFLGRLFEALCCVPVCRDGRDLTAAR